MPTGLLVLFHYRSAEPTHKARSRVWQAFGAIQPFDLRILPRGAVSLYEVARVVHIADMRLAEVGRHDPLVEGGC